MLIRVFVVFSFYAIRSGQQKFAISEDYFALEIEDEGFDIYIYYKYVFRCTLFPMLYYMYLYKCNSDDWKCNSNVYVLNVF